MKKCSWCGAEYPDKYTYCLIDQHELAGIAPPQKREPYPGFIATLLSLRDDLPTIPASAPGDSPRQFSGLLGRYLLCFFVGIFVSLAVSVGGWLCTFCIGYALGDHYAPIFMLSGCHIALALGGFAGVFTGTICLPRGKRAFGSAVLFIVGTIGYVATAFEALCAAEDTYVPLLWIIPAAIGGALAVTFFNWRRWPKYSRRGQSGELR